MVTQQHLSRRHFLQSAALFTTALTLAPALQACVPTAPAGAPAGEAATGAEADWSTAPDVEKAKEQGKDFATYGMPDDWANYGEVMQKFAETYSIELKRTDTDMSSLEEITKFDAEKNNPVAVCADIGLMYGVIAESRGVVPPYMPPSAEKLPVGLKGKEGGWVATFAGVPAFVVNTDVVKNVPQTWADLIKPEYTGMINAMDPTKSGTDGTTFIAWAYANGGDETNLDAAVDFAKQMVGQFSAAASNAQTLEKGEVPIQIKYDFNCAAAAAAVQEKGVNAQVIIPGVSIYAPSALMINKYNVAKMDLAKLFMEFVLSDDAQTIFAKFGARPIRSVLGDLELPAEAKTKWLPDDNYAEVKQVADWSQVNVETIAETWRTKVLGG